MIIITSCKSDGSEDPNWVCLKLLYFSNASGSPKVTSMEDPGHSFQNPLLVDLGSSFQTLNNNDFKVMRQNINISIYVLLNYKVIIFDNNVVIKTSHRRYVFD